MNKHRATALLGAALPLMLALSACGGEEGSSEASKPAAEAATNPDDALDPALACTSREGNPGEIFVWHSYGPDQLPDATQLDAGFVWNGDDETCTTSTEFAIAGAQPRPGFCTEVGKVADNPGYDVNVRPAVRLTSVIARTGDCKTSTGPDAEDVTRASGRKGG